MINVTVIGGYLGAGKTTLVNHLLPHLDGRTVVLVNDFGSIAIDGDLIAAADGDTITLANGCICCSLVDGLAAAMDAIAGIQPRPQRLLIETSGVAEPAAVAAYTHLPGFRLDGIVVVVDAETIRQRADDRYVGDTVRRQLAQADVLVVNKADLLTADELAACRDWLLVTVHRPIVIIEAQHSRVHPGAILGLDFNRQSNAPPAPDKAVSGVAGFHTASFVSDTPVDRDSFAEWLASLSMSVVRVKGILRTSDDAVFAAQRVGSRTSWAPLHGWTGGPSRVALISLDPACNQLAPPGFTLT
jgi:G3E family GTPase